MDSTFVVGIRFSPIGKIYHFDASHLSDLRVGDHVVVETSRGWQLGQIAQVLEKPAQTPGGGLKQVDRKATPRDLLMRKMWQQKEAEVITNASARLVELKLSGIKVVGAEYSFDGARLSIFFNSESEERVELKSLRQDMQKAYAQTQVELRQIGPRDVAKTMCGMGACGIETRCCSRFLVEFNSISIRMAKEQGISLTPSEITGMCGRLRCCLVYEYEQYVEARKLLPKKNKRVMTPSGEGRVIDVSPLRQGVFVEIPESGQHEFNLSEIQLLDEVEQEQIATRPVSPQTNPKNSVDRRPKGDRRKK